ncbi:MAG: NAD(P)/FAD-dependent oxidoreductase [Clostridia bacterium]|nr:NAD(P)/FAD-dependent oxidoreductase [Clostridia bacterium]
MVSNSQNKKNVIIIGSGPAGISAALYTQRAGLPTTVIGKDGGALQKAEKIENYYGLPQPVSGEELLQNGIAQAERLGVTLLREEVIGMTYLDKLTVVTTRGEYCADFVVLATGAARQTVRLPGIAEFEGAGVSYCAVCDGFFHRGKPVAVIGSGEYAMHEAAALQPIASSVTVLTDGKPVSAPVPEGVLVDERRLAAVKGEFKADTVEFADGEQIAVSGVFVAVGVAGSADLARKLGAVVENGRIAVDESGATNIPGLYAAGDCTGGLLQIAKAVGDGAVVGTAIVAAARK